MKYHPSAFIVLMFTLLMQNVQARPYLPSDDAQILQRLPNVLFEKSAQNFRSELQQQPADINRSLALVQQYIQQSRNSGDPRYLGRAEAVLDTVFETQPLPVPVFVMRAILRQANHEFELALQDLNTAIRLDPGYAQAWLTRASIFQVRGDYSQARNDCQQLAKLRQYLVAQVCMAEIASLSGQASQAAQMLKHLAKQLPANDTNNRQWIEGLLADIMTRQDDMHAAEQHYVTALKITAPDMFLLTSYADFLLDQNRPQEVITLLLAHQAADAALLRLAIAANRIQHPQASAWKTELNNRFADSRLRGSNLHQREEARFTLILLQQPESALQLARANWLLQHEPADARLLLEAALAAGKPEAAQPVLTWLQATGMQDVRLQMLRRTLLSVAQPSINRG